MMSMGAGVPKLTELVRPFLTNTEARLVDTDIDIGRPYDVRKIFQENYLGRTRGMTVLNSLLRCAECSSQ